MWFLRYSLNDFWHHLQISKREGSLNTFNGPSHNLSTSWFLIWLIILLFFHSWGFFSCFQEQKSCDVFCLRVAEMITSVLLQLGNPLRLEGLVVLTFCLQLLFRCLKGKYLFCANTVLSMAMQTHHSKEWALNSMPGFKVIVNNGPSASICISSGVLPPSAQSNRTAGNTYCSEELKNMTY